MNCSTNGGLPTTVSIVHFNDVYDIEPCKQEPVGGAARFVTAVRKLNDQNPLVLFSGDAFNPSLLSTVTHGKQMVPVLNAIGVHCALYGNHDFDFGVDNLVKLAQQTKFPWLMSNVYDMMTGDPLADGQTVQMFVWNGVKIGILGLIEHEWIATLATVDPEDVEYLDFVTEGRNLARQLRDQGAEYVIALTHMRWPNDIRLAENVDEIDLVLGGHDHDFGKKLVNGKLIVKSGTDFRGYSLVTITFHPDGKIETDSRECTVDSSIPEDEEIRNVVEEYTRILGDQMDTVLGHIGVDLDGRFSSVRCKETNLGNFIANIMLTSTDSDIALLNSGTLRSDRIHPRGEFRLRDLVAILPLIDNLVVIELSGSQVLEALENGVSKYPALEGRFPQVAGVVFTFDASKKPGERIVRDSVSVQNEPLSVDRRYRLCTKGYLASGKDGYDCLVGGRVVVNEEDGPVLSTIVQNYFESVKMVSGACSKPKYVHRQSIIPVNRRKSVACPLFLQGLAEERSSVSDDDDDYSTSTESRLLSGLNFQDRSTPSPSSCRKIHRRRTLHVVTAVAQRRCSIQDNENVEISKALSPEVEGRITIIGLTGTVAV